MPIGEKLQQKLDKKRETLVEKSKTAERKGTAEIDSGEWLLLFLASGFIDIIFILLTVIGLIPIIGQIIYAIVDPALNLLLMFIFWIYIQYKGLGTYWWLSFGGGLADLLPIANWIGWSMAIFVLYLLVKAEKVPLAGEAIKKTAATAPKIK